MSKRKAWVNIYFDDNKAQKIYFAYFFARFSARLGTTQRHVRGRTMGDWRAKMNTATIRNRQSRLWTRRKIAVRRSAQPIQTTRRTSSHRWTSSGTSISSATISSTTSRCASIPTRWDCVSAESGWSTRSAVRRFRTPGWRLWTTTKSTGKAFSSRSARRFPAWIE